MKIPKKDIARLGLPGIKYSGHKRSSKRFLAHKHAIKGTLMQIWKSPYMFVFI